MDLRTFLISEIGTTKLMNKARKKEMETYGGSGSPKTDKQVKRAQNALSKAKRDKSGAVARATFRAQRALESVILERIKANKELKNKIVNRDPKVRNKFTTTKSGGLHPGAEGDTTLKMAGVSRRMGNKSGAKLWLKASKGKKPTLESILVESLLNYKIDEGKDDLVSDRDSIANAGGDPDMYDKVSREKGEKASNKYFKMVQGVDDRNDARATMRGIVNKHKIEPNSNLKYSKGSFRKAILGSKFAGKYDKQGKPYSRSGITSKNFIAGSKFADSYNKDGKVKGTRTKPTPLNIKGLPGPGKKMQGVRGKSINTSRSTPPEVRASRLAKVQRYQKLFGKKG